MPVVGISNSMLLPKDVSSHVMHMEIDEYKKCMDLFTIEGDRDPEHAADDVLMYLNVDTINKVAEWKHYWFKVTTAKYLKSWMYRFTSEMAKHGIKIDRAALDGLVLYWEA